jgi:hypothetical protein
MRPLLIAGVWGAFICTGAAVVDKVSTPEPQQQWVAAPPMFPKGTQMQVVEGDPYAAGPYSLRVKMPNGQILEVKGKGPLTRE